MVNPHWMRSFLAVVETGGFTRAADRLGLTQAAVSQHLRHLEAEFGPLLIRHPRLIELTPAGQALREYGQEVEFAAKRLNSRLSDASHTSGELSLISPGSVGLALYPILLSLQSAHPGLVVRHRFAPDPEAREAVLSKQYELGLVTLKPEDARLSAHAFLQEPLELVVPAGEAVAGWADLERLGFIDHPDGQAMATRLLTRQLPGNPGIGHLPSRGFSNQIALILEPVSRGLGFTVIPRHARQAFARQDAIQVVELGEAVWDTLWLIHRAEWPLSARAAWAVQQIKERLG
ncbi:LysR family transcriptional regulator [Roseateles depolymerans]|uniref:LysR family transcriptional regulator protein n=1 Tax=Roseateles depolymerans TaxID=76731 RepID=A0A0U3LGK7_9BURK|nr:LysR family transcriptional regulator [Roseateles depolymerans]ALV05618.1 LysR family transcriptional regulator protein [Roseateles depolymerans]REG14363.1 DNA-binding transcriptional LysR family regulator [Roseateles depolymerans]